MGLPKETKATAAPHGRWYGDACGTAFGLEVLGERWSLLIVRELLFGPRRFSDIRRDLPGISAKVLTERLSGLEATGVLRRREVRDPVPARLFELTGWGYAAETIIQEIGRWAAASPLHDPTLPLSPASFMMSMRTMLDHGAARGMKAVVAFSIGDARFVAHLKDGAMPVARGETATPDLSFAAGEAAALAAMFYAGVPADAAGVTATGDAALCGRFLDLFTLPDPWLS